MFLCVRAYTLPFYLLLSSQNRRMIVEYEHQFPLLCLLSGCFFPNDLFSSPAYGRLFLLPESGPQGKVSAQSSGVYGFESLYFPDAVRVIHK